MLPAKILSHFENLPYKYLKVRSFTGELQALKSTSVHFCFGSMTVPDVETIFIDQDRAILGRNILKDTVVLLDGPQEIAKIWFKKQQ